MTMVDTDRTRTKASDDYRTALAAGRARIAGLLPDDNLFKHRTEAHVLGKHHAGIVASCPMCENPTP